MYRKILATLDGSKLSECVLPHIEAFRKGFPECEVVLLRVVEPVYDTAPAHAQAISPEQWKSRENAMRSAAEDYLKDVMAQLGHQGSPIRSEVIIGRVEDQIVEYAEEKNIDLIIIATHGRSGITRWVRGSVADRVLRSAQIPVLMVRAPGTKEGE
ncbi:MAG TPA: universal stress protein [Desulfobacteraceae bacterium]|nr:universal stress protein [Desulfobacteraceae bacterium]